MKKTLALCMFCFVCANTPSMAQEEQNNTSQLTPADVPAPNPQITDTVDFTELRNTFAKRADFEMRCVLNSPKVEWGKAMEAGQFQKAYELASAWLNQCPVDASAHMWAYGALKQLGDVAKADEHKRWYWGIIDSILKTGDGKSPRTAYVTISIAEEYKVLQYKGLKPVEQSVVNGPPTVDKLIAVPMNNNGDKTTIYFNPYWHFVRLSNMVK